MTISSDPADLSACELVKAYAAKRLSPVEVLDSVRARASRCEPALAALWCTEDTALEAAQASEQRWLKGMPLGPLDGVPVTIKENIATIGRPMPLGTVATDLVASTVDAPPAARLRESGALLWAKTTMPDYGMLSSGTSSFHKLSRNPWNTDKGPGGSSSGAGSAAAAGYGPLHMGTDIGGSVRLPAGWCGVYGLKPSLGRIPIDPPFPARAAGPLTRTVADTALAMSVLSRPDPRDHMSLPPADIAWDDLAIEPQGLRIGVMIDAGFGLPVDPAVRAAVEAAAKSFGSAGASVERLAPILSPGMVEGLDRFWRMRAWSDIRRLPASKREKILPIIRQWAEGAASYSGEDVYSGYAQTLAIRKTAVEATQPYDFVLSPTAPITAFPAELPAPTNDPDDLFAHIGFTVPFSMSEQPAASINCGYAADGMPIGLQIVGRRFDDIGVLRLSRLYEQMRPVQRAWPSPS